MMVDRLYVKNRGATNTPITSNKNIKGFSQ